MSVTVKSFFRLFLLTYSAISTPRAVRDSAGDFQSQHQLSSCNAPGQAISEVVSLLCDSAVLVADALGDRVW